MYKAKLSELSEEYIEKLFYFCLKKTGDRIEAEDLTSDIIVNVINELSKGTIPIYFSAWVWKIARNRYSVWADKKHKNTELISVTDLNEMEIQSDDFVEDGFILKEELIVLRRELAFISKDYRDIIIAFYIEDRKVHDIALSLGLPEGTVKTRLFRARKKMKEGISMAREFGVKSYRPENVSFASSGSQPSGLPWTAVNRQIPKNILLHASNNPSTVEELAIELGIAVPYMEEEVNLLTKATLLLKKEEKYITNFFIADKECQMAIYNAQRHSSKERSDIVDTIVSDCLPKIKQLRIMRNNMTDEDFKWLLVIQFVDNIINSLEGFNITYPIKRNDGGDWGFIGFEDNEITERVVTGHNGGGNSGLAMFWTYKIDDYNLWNRAGEMDYNQTLLLADIVKNKRNVSTLTDAEKEIWKGIERFAYVDGNGNVIPNIAVFENNTKEELNKILLQHSLYPHLVGMYQKVYDDTVAILKLNSNPVLYEQLNYCASMFICQVRMMVVHDEVEAKRLIVPKDPEKSTIAMYLEIE